MGRVCLLVPVLDTAVFELKCRLEQRLGLGPSPTHELHCVRFGASFFFSLWAHALSALDFMIVSLIMRYGPNAALWPISQHEITETEYWQSFMYVGAMLCLFVLAT
jgi:hypothetical protein